MLLPRLIFTIIRPVFALLLTFGAIIGVAASVIIMNLLVGYFSVATDAYTSVHPHIAVHGRWTHDEARGIVARVRTLDERVVLAAPALHFERTITLATANVLSDLCGPNATPEASCREDRSVAGATRSYAYNVTELRQADVQIRGVTVDSNETVANLRKLMAGEADLGRLAKDRDSGGNELPIAFIAQDTLISDLTGTYLLSPSGLASTYARYFRLHGVMRLGAKSSGAPLLVFGLEQARAFAPTGHPNVNVIEVRLGTPLAAEQAAATLRAALGPDVRVESWVDKERPAFQFLNATWVMVFAVMLSICLVVAISIYSTLTLSVVRNRWKVALLGVIGLTPLRIGMIFVGFGLSVAIVGIAGGTLLGHYASFWVGGALYNRILGLPFERFAATVTLQPAAWMATATLIIFILSVILPARRAVSIRPANALRGQV